MSRASYSYSRQNSSPIYDSKRLDSGVESDEFFGLIVTKSQAQRKNSGRFLRKPKARARSSITLSRSNSGNYEEGNPVSTKLSTQPGKNRKRSQVYKRRRQVSAFMTFRDSRSKTGRQSNQKQIQVDHRKTWLERQRQRNTRKTRYSKLVSDRETFITSSIFKRLQTLSFHLASTTQELNEDLETELFKIEQKCRNSKLTNVELSQQAFLYICTHCYGTEIDTQGSSERVVFQLLWDLLSTRNHQRKLALRNFETFCNFLWKNYEEFTPTMTRFPSFRLTTRNKSSRASGTEERSTLGFLQNPLQKLSNITRISSTRRTSYVTSTPGDFSDVIYVPSNSLCSVVFKYFDMEHKGWLSRAEFELLVKTFLGTRLQDFLRNIPEGRKSLRIFLGSECNTELLDFYNWVRAKQLEYSPSGDGFDFAIPVEVAEQALHHYIQAEAEQALNVDSNARAAAVCCIESALASGSKTIAFSFFKPLFIQNLTLLENDALCRYISQLGRHCRNNEGTKFFLLADEVWSRFEISKNIMLENDFILWAKGTQTLFHSFQGVTQLVSEIISKD